MKALAFGDLHAGVGRDLAPDRLKEQEQILRDILTLARSERCDIVLNGGDLFEKRAPRPDEVLAVSRPLAEHRDAGGPPVLGILGNHEVSGAADATMPAAVALGGLMTLSTIPEVLNIVGGEITRDLAVPGGIAVCTLPWTPVSRLVASQDGGDRDAVFQQAADLLIQTAADLRGQVDRPAVLLLHWSIDAASLPSGLPVAMLREVVLPASELALLGFDWIVASHIHKAQVLHEQPWIAYTGSPLALNFGEGNDKHGVWIIDTAGTERRYVPLNSRGFETLQLDGDDHLYEYAEALCMDAFVKVRVDATAEQARAIDVAAVRQAVEEAGAVRAWVEVNTPRQARARVEGLDEATGPLDALGAYLAAQGVNGQVGAALLARAGGYLERTRA